MVTHWDEVRDLKVLRHVFDLVDELSSFGIDSVDEIGSLGALS